MTDQPKPMSVEAAIAAAQEALHAWHSATGADKMRKFDAFITAVRAEERGRVLAEFRNLAEKYSTINYAPIRDSTEHKNTVTAGMKIVQGELSALIQSLETPNKKP